MGESVVTNVTAFSRTARQRSRARLPHHDGGLPADGQPCTLEARIDATSAATARILRALHGGCGTFIITAIDGQMSARIDLSVISSAATEAEYTLGSAQVRIDWSRATVANGARCVSLSRTELRLLAALLDGEGKPLSRTVLIGRMWPDDNIPERGNALGVYIHSLRKRLAAIGAGDALQTVRGTGYRIVG